jgi:hypothetical protein
MSGEPEQGFKRDMSVEAAVVAKDEFVEIVAREEGCFQAGLG